MSWLPGWAKTTLAGAVVLVLGVLTMGVGVGLVAALAIATGVAVTTTGIIQGVLAATDQTTPAQDERVTDAALTATTLASPGGLVGGAIGAGLGGERGMHAGSLVGNLAELGAGLGQTVRSLFARRAVAREVAGGGADAAVASSTDDFIQGAAQSPRTYPWRPNENGIVRTAEEAIEIARQHGVEIPDDIQFFFREPSTFPPKRWPST